MKQTAAAPEKMDPLTRIQEEIKEVVRREQEHKKFIKGVTTTNGHDDAHNDNPHDTVVSNESNEPLSIRSNLQDSTDDELPLDENSNTKTFKIHEHHSDDSGISGASSPVNGTSTNLRKSDEKHSDLKLDISHVNTKEQRYIRPNCYNLTPEPPQQKLIRTLPSPHVNAAKNRKFNVGPAQKGLMQRFIASRGKLQINGNTNDSSYPRNIVLSEKSLNSLVNNSPSLRAKSPNFDSSDNEFRSVPYILDSATARAPASIERDEEGRPIRPGYVPVELKIQRELRDLKSRESELKKIRKTRQSTPDLLDALQNEDSDDEDDFTEHCYGPNKLRTAKSISELCDAAHYVNSFSSSNILSENIKNELQSSRNDSMKPAVSLAQLCDLDPEEAPSSHRLIAQWENIIQQNA